MNKLESVKVYGVNNEYVNCMLCPSNGIGVATQILEFGKKLLVIHVYTKLYTSNVLHIIVFMLLLIQHKREKGRMNMWIAYLCNIDDGNSSSCGGNGNRGGYGGGGGVNGDRDDWKIANFPVEDSCLELFVRTTRNFLFEITASQIITVMESSN